MTKACDERSSREGGCEKEEPNEPSAPSSCFVRVYGGYRRLREWLDSLKPALYEYNEAIKSLGYYLKPVHKVYYRDSSGRLRVYEYYGRYWWKIAKDGKRRRLIYAGRVKPRGLPEPPPLELEGVRVIVEEGEDVVIECSLFERVKRIFEGLRVERLWEV